MFLLIKLVQIFLYFILKCSKIIFQLNVKFQKIHLKKLKKNVFQKSLRKFQKIVFHKNPKFVF